MDFNKKQVPKQPMRMIRKITDGSWRAFATVPQAPPKLNALLIQCLDLEPQARPTFEDILSELSGAIKSETEDGNFDRQPVGNCDDFDLLDESESDGNVESSSASDGFFDGANPIDKTRFRAASLLQQQAGDYKSSEAPRLESQGTNGRAHAEGDASRNPMIPAATHDTSEEHLSQQLSQVGRPSTELPRVEKVTYTEV